MAGAASWRYRKTDNGVPGGWNNRFKNAFEPVYHFSRQPRIKFRPDAVGHFSDDCFDYSPQNAKSSSGSGLLGKGPRGAGARQPGVPANAGWHTGLARPSNVIEAKSESGQGAHSAPFPRPLVEFFIGAFSDASDVVFDPFLGSGTTLAAAHLLKRIAWGSEISPAYCDVALRRIAQLVGEEPVLDETGQSMEKVTAARSGETEKAIPPRARDSRRKPRQRPAKGGAARRKAA
jgi:hypothetical protein